MKLEKEYEMENQKVKKNTHRATAIIVGMLILAAYSVIGSGNPEAKILGMVLEVISGVAVIVIAVLMYQIFKPHYPKYSIWYMLFRILEGGLLVVTGILFLSDNNVILSVYDAIHVGHGFIFVIAALLFNYLLYQTKIVPRWLSVFGIVATIMLLVVNLLEITGVVSELMILKLPIFLNEIILALWLIVKGFTPAEIVYHSN